MGDNCQVNSTIYTFSIGGISNGLIGCGSPPVQPLVVGNQSMGSAVLYVHKRDGPPNCTYVITWGRDNYVQDQDGNVVIRTLPATPSEWVITPRDNNQYTVVLKGTDLAWTDPGGEGGCERELHLTPLDPLRSEVLFQMWPAPAKAEEGTVVNMSE